MFYRTLLFAATVAVAAAQQQQTSEVLSFSRVPNPVTDGEAQAITYLTNDTTTPVTIILRKGAAGNLDTISTLTTNAFGGQYVWTPATSLPNGIDYALEIKQNNQVNYFGPFVVQGYEGGTYSSSNSSSSTVTSSASSAGATGGAGAVGAGTAGTSMGTGLSIPRNTTMSMATLTSSGSSPTGAGMTTSAGAGFQGSSSATASPTSNGASAEYHAGGAVAAVVGLAAAAFL